MNGVGGISLKGNFQLIRSVIGIGPQRSFALRIRLPGEIHGVASLEINDIRFHQIVQRVCMANTFHRQIHGYSCRIKVSLPEGNHCLSVSIEIPSVFRIISVIGDGNGGCRHVDGKFRGSVRDGLIGQDISGPVHSVELHIEAVAVVGGRDGDVGGETFCSYEFAVGLRTYIQITRIGRIFGSSNCHIFIGYRLPVHKNIVSVTYFFLVDILYHIVNFLKTGINCPVMGIRIIYLNLQGYVSVINSAGRLIRVKYLNRLPLGSHIIHDKSIGTYILYIARKICNLYIDNIFVIGRNCKGTRQFVGILASCPFLPLALKLRFSCPEGFLCRNNFRKHHILNLLYGRKFICRGNRHRLLFFVGEQSEGDNTPEILPYGILSDAHRNRTFRYLMIHRKLLIRFLAFIHRVLCGKIRLIHAEDIFYPVNRIRVEHYGDLYGSFITVVFRISVSLAVHIGIRFYGK